MLKPQCNNQDFYDQGPAAFGRLCVETILGVSPYAVACLPAAFGRLCVETLIGIAVTAFFGPAAFGRLCVETNLRRANWPIIRNQPPSGGCVLKL